MSTHDEDRPVRMASGWWRSHRVAAGVVGLAALLGGGAYLLTSHLTDHGSTRAPEAGAVRPLVTSSSGARSSAASADAGADSVIAPSPSTAPSQSTSSSPSAPLLTLAPSVAAEIKKAREQSEKDGYPVLRPLTPAANAVMGPVDVRNTSDKRGSVRILTAKHDLSGQREMLWAADGGRPVGSARCTDKFHFSNAEKPHVLPTMLLCWRTSSAKSVVVVKVSFHGKPQATETVAILDREWAKL
ncbi:hypothetical protein ACQP2F_35900 [Actinoplanes sp. CA-030573]|uniref:hypothetical protein n=1 Tax=Actinoplanes sp. CA-030573 TaxID=3239898 RepID=UPI003D89E17E